MENKLTYRKSKGEDQPRFTEFSLRPEDTALLIIDMQYCTAHPEYGFGHRLEEIFPQSDAGYYYRRLATVVVPNQQRLLDFFRKHGLRVIYVVSGSLLADGSDRDPAKLSKFPHKTEFEHRILKEIDPKEGELILEKTTYSAFTSTGIDQALRNMGIRQVVVAGVGTNGCVEITARDADDRGYRCTLVDDACATFTQTMHDHTLLTFALFFGKVKTTEEVIADLEREITKSVL